MAIIVFIAAVVVTVACSLMIAQSLYRNIKVKTGKTIAFLLSLLTFIISGGLLLVVQFVASAMIFGFHR